MLFGAGFDPNMRERSHPPCVMFLHILFRVRVRTNPNTTAAPKKKKTEKHTQHAQGGYEWPATTLFRGNPITYT